MSDPNIASHLDEDTLGENTSDADVRDLVVRGIATLFGGKDTPTYTLHEDGGVDIDFGPKAEE